MVALGSAPPFISTSLITGPAPEPEVTRAIRVGGEACYCHLLGVDAEVGGRAELRGARGRCALSAGVVSLGFLDWRGAGGRGRLELELELEPEEERSHHDASRLFCFFHHSVRWAGAGAGTGGWWLEWCERKILLAGWWLKPGAGAV